MDCDRLLVGLYFGSFNPLTENHVGICKRALRRMDKIYIVPNPENPSKPDMLPLKTRIKAIQRRAACRDLKECSINVFDATGMNLDWRGRSIVCNIIINQLRLSNPKAAVEMYQMIGSDSFNTRGCQEALQNDEIRSSLKRKLMIFMRNDSGPLIIQACLAGLVEVPAYCDRHTTSSTAVRKSLREGSIPATRDLHPQVYEEIREYYTASSLKRKQPSDEPATILLVGGPGAGKTTLGAALVKVIGGVSITTGDLFRIGKSIDLPGWPRAGLPASSPSWKYFQDISELCVQELCENASHIIIDGISLETPEQVLSFTKRNITHVVVLDCDKGTLMYRMMTRNRSGEHTEEARETRASKYLSRHWARERVLKILARDTDIVHLKGSMTVPEMVRRIAQVTGLQQFDEGHSVTTEEIEQALMKTTKVEFVEAADPVRICYGDSPSYMPTSPSYMPTSPNNAPLGNINVTDDTWAGQVDKRDAGLESGRVADTVMDEAVEFLPDYLM